MGAVGPWASSAPKFQKIQWLFSRPLTTAENRTTIRNAREVSMFTFFYPELPPCHTVISQSWQSPYIHVLTYSCTFVKSTHREKLLPHGFIPKRKVCEVAAAVEFRLLLILVLFIPCWGLDHRKRIPRADVAWFIRLPKQNILTASDWSYEVLEGGGKTREETVVTSGWTPFNALLMVLQEAAQQMKKEEDKQRWIMVLPLPTGCAH